MADNETIADIIAWLRRPREGENGYLTVWRDEIADRLEAAHKRERGDVAKLREALGKLRAELWNNTVIAGKRKFELYEIADAALSAPPRNCDLYKTKEEAQAAFMKEACDHPCGNCWVEDINNECGVEWLLAPAAERGAK